MDLISEAALDETLLNSNIIKVVDLNSASVIIMEESNRTGLTLAVQTPVGQNFIMRNVQADGLSFLEEKRF